MLPQRVEGVALHASQPTIDYSNSSTNTANQHEACDDVPIPENGEMDNRMHPVESSTSYVRPPSADKNFVIDPFQPSNSGSFYGNDPQPNDRYEPFSQIWQSDSQQTARYDMEGYIIPRTGSSSSSRDSNSEETKNPYNFLQPSAINAGGTSSLYDNKHGPDTSSARTSANPGSQSSPFPFHPLIGQDPTASSLVAQYNNAYPPQMLHHHQSLQIGDASKQGQSMGLHPMADDAFMRSQQSLNPFAALAHGHQGMQPGPMVSMKHSKLDISVEPKAMNDISRWYADRYLSFHVSKTHYCEFQ
jgi:hypothetical protein